MAASLPSSLTKDPARLRRLQGRLRILFAGGSPLEDATSAVEAAWKQLEEADAKQDDQVLQRILHLPPKHLNPSVSLKPEK